jgi:hypothetical protein
MSVSTCKNHPQAAATCTCQQCQSPICDACVRTTPQGLVLCPACEPPEPLDTLDTESPDSTYELSVPAPAPPAQEYRSTLSFGKPCKAHPDAVAVAICHQCRSPICATCDFPFPGGIHLCPACATNPKQGLTTKRKRLTHWSIGLGVFSMMLLVIGIIAAVTSGGTESGLQFAGCFVCLSFPACVVGFVLGVTTFNKKAENPGILWVGPVLNGLVIAFFIVRIATMILSGGR